MKVLIIGGAGYIGGVTTHLCVEAGHDVTVVDNLETGRDYNVPESAIFIQGDIRDKAFVQKLFSEGSYDTIMHFAAKILVSESMEKPFEYFENNTVASLYVIDAAAKAGVKRYIFSSTAATYGAPIHVPVLEDDPTQPVNPYGFSKLLTENLLKSYEITHGLQWAAFRYFNVAGAYNGVGPDYPFVSHIIPMLLDKLSKQEPITIFGTDYQTPDGTCIRDYVHVADIAKAHLLAANVMEAGTSLNQPINLGSNSGFSVKEVVDAFQSTTGQTMQVEHGQRRAGDPDKLIASNQRAKELLQWQPEHDLASIITDHYQWYKTKKS